MAGREFDIEQTDDALTGYIHAERRFKIVPAEIEGQVLPNSASRPSAGDKYAIFGIALPTAYICDNATKTGASWDMFREAVRVLYEKGDNQFSFTGSLTPTGLKKVVGNRWEDIARLIHLVLRYPIPARGNIDKDNGGQGLYQQTPLPENRAVECPGGFR